MKKDTSQTKKLIDVDNVSLPKGGGAFKGMGDDLDIELFKGEGNFKIPIYSSPCRDAHPTLTLQYSASTGNGLFGVGFALDLPTISRRTTKKIPTYDDKKDTFLFSGKGELVPGETREEKGGFTVTRYCPRKEQSFDRIEYWKTEQGAFWQVTDRENRVSLFGEDRSGRVADPDNPAHVFSWLLCETTDGKGNKIRYHYDGEHRISEILYGNYRSESGGDEWAFALAFSYTSGRFDAFRRYNSGFLIETGSLCEKILMIHQMGQKRRIVRETAFQYASENGVSLLEKISVTGSKENGDGTEERKQMPDLCLSYTRFTPQEGTFRLIETDNHLPFLLDKGGFRFVDLYGEGIAGLLYSDATEVLYCRPLGDCRYEAPRVLSEFPLHHNLSDEHYTLTSLEGNGKYDMVIRSSSVNGFYALQEGAWQNYQSFEKEVNEWTNSQAETADLQGDRLSHFMITSKSDLRYYPSLKKRGADYPVSCRLPKDFPHKTQNSPCEAVRFVELLGDGLQHRVRVKSGSVECFPNLGYGRFGEKITLQNAPSIPEMDASRLFFADLDGSGAADLLYVYPDRVEVYRNQGGMGFSAPFPIYMPEPYARGDSITFADVTGSGAKCMIFSKLGRAAKHYCYDFTCGTKPYMLSGIDRNCGFRISLRYESSVCQYLQDRKNGQYWKCRPPFPIQLITEKTEDDALSCNRKITAYHYRDGLYDYEENEFKGFGEIEQWVTQKNSCYGKEIQSVHTKKWFYIGAGYEERYSRASVTGKPLPSGVFDATDIPEAEKALWGSALREETYAGGQAAPVTAEQFCYKVTERIPPAAGQRGSYEVHSCETVRWRLEENPADPAVEHEFNVETDAFGNVLHHCVIQYPRRQPPPSLPKELIREQTTLRVTETKNRFLNKTGGVRRLGLPVESRVYELSGLCCDEIFALETLLEELKKAEQIAYGAEFIPGSRQARLSQWSRSYYWDDAGSAPLALGSAGSRVLLHHQEKAVFPNDFAVLSSHFDRQTIEDCGYHSSDGYWWAPEAVTHYCGQESFYLPREEEHPGTDIRTTLSYDPYHLLPVRMTRRVSDEEENSTSALIDYTTLHYKQIIDENDNVSQALYDPLGNLIVKTAYGTTCGQREGDDDVQTYLPQQAGFSEVVTHPEQYLQGMTSYCYYDLLAYQREKQPVSCILLTATGDEGEPAQMSVTSWDAFGRELQQAVCVDDGRWSVSNRAVYDGQGNQLLVYPAYFTTEARDTTDIPDIPPVRNTYDWQKRNICREKPDGGSDGIPLAYLCAETRYHTWEEQVYDENSRLESSAFYKEFCKAYPEHPTEKQADERDALQKALAFTGRAKTRIFDNRGNRIADLLEDQEGNYVRYSFDCGGNVTQAADARLRLSGACNLRRVFDMRGKELQSQSCDAGYTLQLKTAQGAPAHHIDGNGVHKIFTCDGLMRPLTTLVPGVGIVERTEYGEQAEQSRENNLRGKVYRRWDQAGIERFRSYTFRGLAREKHRFLCRGYEGTVDWSRENELEPDGYREQYAYNTAGQITERTTPDDCIYRYRYDRRGLLKRVFCDAEEAGQTQDIVAALTYNAAGKRATLRYGNGVTTQYHYSEATGLLQGVYSAKPTREILQNLWYTYDPAGNVTRIRDLLTETVLHRQQAARPIWDYEYDSYYRLRRAAGRELAGEKSDFQSLIPYRQEYSYDAGGNLVRIKHAGAAHSYTLEMGMAADSNRMTEAEGPLAYDGCGNLTNLPNLRSMEWNYDNRLVRAILIARDDRQNDEEFYAYDTTGTRVRKVTRRLRADGQAEITDKIYLGDFSVKRVTFDSHKESSTSLRVSSGETPHAVVYRFLTGRQGGGAKREGEPRICYQLENHLNCVGVELNEKAEVIRFEEYYPFGGTALLWCSRCEVDEKEYRFCNKELDSATGLYYYGARYYSSAYGRMIAADGTAYISFDDWQTLNLYTYCKNNPICYTDPTGNFPFVTAALTLLAGAAVFKYLKKTFYDPTPYPSADAAAQAFSRNIYSASSYTRHEYSTEIYSRVNGATTSYYYTKPAVGSPHSASGIDMHRVPTGTTPVAYAHTHPNSNSFSPADKNYANRHGINAYVIGPNDHVQRYDHTAGAETDLGAVTPAPLSSWEKPYLRWSLRNSWESHFTGNICPKGFPCVKANWPN